MTTRKRTLANNLRFSSFTYYLFPSQAKRFGRGTIQRMEKLDQGNFDFGFAEGFEIVAGNPAIGDGFVHA